MIENLLAAYRLKDRTRTGWELRGIEEPEDVAAHSWGTAYLCLVIGRQEDGIDVDHAVAMAVVHDIAESITGDPPRRYDGQAHVDLEGKEDEERAAMDDLLAGMDADRIRELWEQYEARETPEARFVKDMDLIDMALQALLYERGDRYDPDADNPHFNEYEHLDEFMVSAEDRLRSETAKELFEEIEQRYQETKR
jgi:putative hydrolase of HD superfamily